MMAEIMDVFKKNKGEPYDEFDDEVSRELLKYGQSLDEWKQLESLDDEYRQAKDYMEETQQKLVAIEKEMKKIEKESAEKAKAAHNCHIQAKALYDKKEYRAAIDKWNEALGFNADHPGARYGINEAKDRIKETHEEKLKNELKLKEKQEKAEDHFHLGKKYFIEEKYEAALLEWKEAITYGGREQKYLDAMMKAEFKIKETMEERIRLQIEDKEKKDKIQELLVEGRKYLREEKFEEAIEILDKILLIDAQNRFGLDEIRKAEQLKREYERQKIEKEAARIEELRRIRDYQIRAAEFERKGVYESAIEMLAKVLDIDPNQENVLEEIKLLERKIKDREQKKKDEIILIEEVLKKKEAEKFRQEKEKQEKLQNHYSKGMKFFALANYERAVEEFEQVMLLDNNYERTPDMLEESSNKMEAKRLEKIKKEEEEKRRALELSAVKKQEEEKIELEIRELFKRGLRFYDNKEYEKAIEEWENALVFRRNDVGIKIEIEKARAQIEERLNIEKMKHQENLKKQEEDARRNSLLRLYSDQAEVYFREDEYEKSIEEWKKIIELDFKSDAARENILKAERAIKEIERKKLESEKRKRELAKEIQELLFRAEELFNEEMYESAVERWEKILKLDSLNKQAQNGIIKTKAKLKEIEMRKKAKQLAEDMMREEEERIKAMRESYEAGERLYREGDFSKALKEWEKSMGRFK